MVLFGGLGVHGEALMLALIVLDDVVVVVFTRAVVHVLDGWQTAALVHICSILFLLSSPSKTIISASNAQNRGSPFTEMSY